MEKKFYQQPKAVFVEMQNEKLLSGSNGTEETETEIGPGVGDGSSNGEGLSKGTSLLDWD